MIALLFGTYNSRHAANALLAADLRAAGFEVREHHRALWEETRDKDAPYFAPAGLARLALRYVMAAAALVAGFRRRARDAAVVVAGFNGQLDILLARALAGRRCVLFAPLVTVSETLIDDRRSYREGSLAGRLLRALDRASLAAADLVVIDTAAHRDYLAARLGVAPGRVLVQYLGAEPQFAPVVRETRGASGATHVLCYSQYLPLHGSDVIARAAALVPPGSGVTFELVGTGPERARCDAIVHGLPHARVVDWVPYEELPARIAAADVVLGVFGSSEKARMVVPNKVYQAAQVGSAIVTADTPAIREVFRHGESIWAVEAVPQALADAILALARDASLRARLARGARAAVERAAGPAVRAERLRAALAERGIAPLPAAAAESA